MGLYQYDSTEDKLNLVAGSTNFSDAPVGAIFPFGGTDIPISFLLCDGSAVSRTDYEDLFNVIGTAFGTGDGSTTFNLPDLRESVPKGAGETGQTVGAHVKSGGLTVGEFLDDRLQEHTHRKNANWGNFTASNFPAGADGSTGADAVTFGSVYDARSGATTEVKSVGVNYIIKAKMVALPADLASGVEEFLKPVSGTVSFPSSINNYHTYLKKSGKVVSLYIDGTITTALAGTGALIATLPEGFRPKSAFYQLFTARYLTDQYQGAYTVVVNTDGTIKTATGGGTFENNQSFCINMTYMLD